MLVETNKKRGQGKTPFIAERKNFIAKLIIIPDIAIIIFKKTVINALQSIFIGLGIANYELILKIKLWAITEGNYGSSL
jgi:hypothetical protein